ncbi:MAG: polysaccharide deacetylase family protein [Clostridia bacterium]|nr:polysaccharide deacetylase family protein [Clostridia bacterium]
MKIFVMRKNSIIFYVILFAVALTIVFVNRKEADFVFNNNSELNDLPIYCVDKGEEKICAISFDAAWGNEDTEKLIEILDEYDVKTTFFVVGSWVDKYPESVKALHDAGHEIMNHSDTHPHMTKISADAMKTEIEKCDTKIESITGEKPFLFRPPYGDYNSKVIETLAECGHYTVQWSVDSLDWKDLTADEICTRVTEKIHPGAIVLFHNAAKNTPDALPKILGYMKENNYKVVPVSDIIHKDNYTIDHTGKQILKNNNER